MGNTNYIAIAVARQMASGGSLIAYSVARKLKFKYLDNEVLYKAAKFMGLDSRELAEREERIESFIEHIAKCFRFGSPEAPYVYPSGLPVYGMDIFDVEAKLIKEVANSCNVVIVGRASHCILKGHSGLVKVFVHAPFEYRVKRLMEIRNISDSKIATAEIQESDKRRRNFLRNQTGIEWTDASNYHLCINAAETGFEAAVEMIVSLAATKARPPYESGKHYLLNPGKMVPVKGA